MTPGGGRTSAAPEDTLRGDARAIVEAALAAVEPARLTDAALREELARPESFSRTLRSGRPLRLVAVGKAAIGMARGATAALQAVEGVGPDAVRGIVLAPEGGSERRASLPPTLRFRTGGHPLPTHEGAAGAREIARLVAEANAGDHVLVLLSGGGSALLALPVAGLTLEDLRITTDRLLRAGASIEEVNTVRKHMERLKGGGLARLAAPASTLALVVSDVIGDRLDLIASGPLVPDPSTFADALEVVDRFDPEGLIPKGVRAFLQRGIRGDQAETARAGDPCFAKVRHRLVGTVSLAAEGAAGRARALGYRPLFLGVEVGGEAREVGRRLGALAATVHDSRGRAGPVCLLSGGEPTVTVRGAGRGGRNQEVALGAAPMIDGLEGVLVGSVGTDGVDGPTDAAGAVATGRTLLRARSLGLDPERALRENDAYPFFDILDDLVRTGPTGTNVMDVQMALIR